MTREATFFSGEVMERHWSNEDGGVATMAAKKKSGAKKKKPTKRPTKATRRGPGCQSGKKTC
jgi:hypothetical protein